MSTLQDRKSAVTESYPQADKTAKALAGIERDKLKRERNGAVIGMAVGGFGKSVFGGWLGVTVKYIPIIMGAGFATLAVYALILSVS